MDRDPFGQHRSVRSWQVRLRPELIYIAYPQIIAEELGMPLEAITDVVSGDTDRTPDGGGTFGLLRTNVVNLRKVAAYTREAILELAAQRFGVPRAQLTAKDGVVSTGGQSLTVRQAGPRAGSEAGHSRPRQPDRFFRPGGRRHSRSSPSRHIPSSASR